MTGSTVSNAGRGLIDLRRLQQFVAVVESGSLTEAASLLGQSQQALSVAIKSLEAQVGTRLFERTRGMRPSPAGLRLYDSATVLLAGAERILPDVQRMAIGEGEVLRVGYTPAIDSVEVFDLIAGALPDCTSVHVKRMFPDDLSHALYRGDVDLAFQRGLERPAELAGGVVSYGMLNVAVVSEVAVADAESVSMSELADLRMILWAPESRSRYSTYLVDHFRRAGYEPTTVVTPFQGFAPEAAPLAVPDGFAMVSAEPGEYYGGRIVVVALREEVKVPVLVLALPTATGVVECMVARLVNPPQSRESVSARGTR